MVNSRGKVAAITEMTKKNVVIIGNGMVGHKFCEKLVSKSTNFQLTVFGEEPRIAYDRVHLSSYFDGKTVEDLSLSTTDWYRENNIQLFLGDAVTEVNRSEKVVHTQSGKAQAYDYLIIATGSAPFVPNIPGVEKDGVFVYRTIEDLDKMKAHAAKCTSGAVMGGGLLGLEAGKALLDLGIKETHIVEFASRAPA